MCCGEIAEDVWMEPRAARSGTGGVMARVFTTVKGSVQRIGGFGEATNDTPAIVPDDVAKELAKAEGLRVEKDEPAHKALKKEAK